MSAHAYDTCGLAPCALCAAWQAGVAWAEREIEAARDQGREIAGPWRGTEADCRALVEDADDAQQIADCDEAARTAWDAAVDAASDE